MRFVEFDFIARAKFFMEVPDDWSAHEYWDARHLRTPDKLKELEGVIEVTRELSGPWPSPFVKDPKVHLKWDRDKKDIVQR